MDYLVREYLYNALNKLKQMRSGEINANCYYDLCETIEFDGSQSSRLNKHQNKRLETILCDIFKSWPEFSGDFGYPVPYKSDTCHSPMVGFIYANHHCKLYDRNTKYGRARWRLCDHMIKEITNILEGVR